MWVFVALEKQGQKLLSLTWLTWAREIVVFSAVRCHERTVPLSEMSEYFFSRGFGWKSDYCPVFFVLCGLHFSGLCSIWFGSSPSPRNTCDRHCVVDIDRFAGWWLAVFLKSSVCLKDPQSTCAARTWQRKQRSAQRWLGCQHGIFVTVTEMDLNLSRCLAEMDSVSWDDLTFWFPCLHRTHPLSADSITDLRPSQEDWLGSPPGQTSLWIFQLKGLWESNEFG